MKKRQLARTLNVQGLEERQMLTAVAETEDGSDRIEGADVEVQQRLTIQDETLMLEIVRSHSNPDTPADPEPSAPRQVDPPTDAHTPTEINLDITVHPFQTNPEETKTVLENGAGKFKIEIDSTW